jgi:hypothetical protein
MTAPPLCNHVSHLYSSYPSARAALFDELCLFLCTATDCTWVNATNVQPLFTGDSVGSNTALRFSQADDGTVYFMVMNERRAHNASNALPPQEDYSFGAVYASTDSGQSFQYRGSPGRFTSENNLLPLGKESLLAAVRLQDETGLRSATLSGPHYKQSAITKSTDAGRCVLATPISIIIGTFSIQTMQEQCQIASLFLSLW